MNKGFLQATTTKDGIEFGLFNTHLDAGILDSEIRENQVTQLMAQVANWWITHPVSTTFVGGDFNIAGLTSDHSGNNGLDRSNCSTTDEYGFDCWEYWLFKSGFDAATMADTHRQAPGFYCSSKESKYTVNRENDLHIRFSGSSPSELLDYILYLRVLPNTSRNHVVPENFLVHPMIASIPISDGNLTTTDLSDHYAVVADFTIFGDIIPLGATGSSLSSPDRALVDNQRSSK